MAKFIKLIRSLIARNHARMERNRSIATTCRELHRLSDHEVRDLGISRYDIERIARMEK